MIDYEQFEAVEIRVGTVRSVRPLAAAKTPAWVLEIDFGALGTLKSSSQLTDTYDREELVGRQVFAVTNLRPKQVGGVLSRCLVLGVYTRNDREGVVLATPDRPVADGLRLL
jgi:tRNA-binding protein